MRRLPSLRMARSQAGTDLKADSLIRGPAIECLHEVDEVQAHGLTSVERACIPSQTGSIAVMLFPVIAGLQGIQGAVYN